MLFFGKKNKAAEPAISKKAKNMPYSKKVQFCFIKTDELTEMLENDISGVLTLEPVNYYASKNKFYLCVFYYNEGYEEIIMNFELHENDHKVWGGNYYIINKELYSKILLKFGQRINL